MAKSASRHLDSLHSWLTAADFSEVSVLRVRGHRHAGKLTGDANWHVGGLYSVRLTFWVDEVVYTGLGGQLQND